VVTALSPLQERMWEIVGFSSDVYTQLLTVVAEPPSNGRIVSFYIILSATLTSCRVRVGISCGLIASAQGLRHARRRRDAGGAAGDYLWASGIF
jgi:hypothetical protein